MRSIWIFATMLMLTPRIGVAQSSMLSNWPRPRDDSAQVDDTARVAFSFSGGISLGVYQAGVNWAIIEFIKRVRDDASFRRTYNLPVIKVTAMTGASAGAVNVLLGAIEYCDKRGAQRPDSSLFWKMWVLTGWNELSPRDGWRDSKSADIGVLDRGSVKTHVLPAIDDAMRSRAFVSDCEFPAGVTATRIAGNHLSYDQNIRVQNQRFVTLFEMRQVDGDMRIARPRESLLRARELGAQMVLPVEDHQFVATQRVFDVVEASSSYPVAFAPKLIAYHEPECVLAEPRLPCTKPKREMFMDGGVFDNNPVSLALGIQRIAKNTKVNVKPTLPKEEERRRVIFVDPGALRGTLKSRVELRAVAEKELRVEGINALMHFAGGFIPAARNYEVQAFMRQAWESNAPPDLVPLPSIMSSTRAHPILGDYFNAFASFFGRPFREFDFYDGVADGLRFVAMEIMCDRARLTRQGNSGYAGDRRRLFLDSLQTTGDSTVYRAAQATCTDRITAKLANETLLNDPVGHNVVAHVLRRELASAVDTVILSDVPAKSSKSYLPPRRLPKKMSVLWPRGPARTSDLPSERERASVLIAIEKATFAQLDDVREYRCNSGDVAASLLCYDGFERVLDSLSKDEPFKKTVSAWSKSAACRVSTPEEYHAEDCMAEDILVDFLDNSKSAMQGVLDRAINQMRTAEGDMKDRGKPDSKFLVKTGEFLYRSIDHKARRGLDLDPSSIPPRDNWYWQALHFLPYYGGVSIGMSGVQIGWQPTLHTKWFMLSLPFEADNHPDSFNPQNPNVWYGSVSPSVGRSFSLGWLNQLSIGGRTEINVRRGDAPSRRSPLMPEISALTMMGKVRLSLYRLPESVTWTGKTLYRGTVSLADLNGVSYWVFR